MKLTISEVDRSRTLIHALHGGIISEGIQIAEVTGSHTLIAATNISVRGIGEAVGNTQVNIFVREIKSCAGSSTHSIDIAIGASWAVGYTFHVGCSKGELA